jgi:N-carbamoyl-L-amino-acid hydrolase
MKPAIDAGRLWRSVMEMAAIGPIPGNGNCRLALTPADTEARSLLLRWCGAMGLAHQQDAIGNMFLRRAGADPAAQAVAFGSHLDTVPTGGRFDGVAGVLAGLEVLRALDDAGLRTKAPLELVNWMNEEGSRFHPAMMGSRVAAGAMPLAAALAVTDDAGVSVAQALADSGQAGPLTPAPRDWRAWLELHIEQGPVMEATGTDIGIVTGAMHARYFNLTVTGEPSHVGTTALGLRKDSLAAAAAVILAVERIGLAAEPNGRASATWIENTPNARGNVPHLTRLHCDVRHTDAAESVAMEAALRAAIDAIAAKRGVRIEVDPYATFGPIVFDPTLCALLRTKATERQLSVRDMTAAAGHDSVFMAGVCPSAMVFIPSVGGITHNPAEYSTQAQLASGAQVLLDAVLELAG